MPELPEVHTIATQLQKELPGKTIKEVWLDWPRQIRNQTPSAFKKALGGKRVLAVRRIGKNVMIDLTEGLTLLAHMKMTGHLMYGKWEFDKKTNKWVSVLGGVFNDSQNRFIHVLFQLSNGYDLAFSDMRKFGRFELLKTAETDTVASLKKLGPDAMSKQLNAKTFEELLLKRPHSPIKQVLMNQEIIAGVGNIYADEMLSLKDYHSGVAPIDLSPKEIALAKRLFKLMTRPFKHDNYQDLGHLRFLEVLHAKEKKLPIPPQRRPRPVPIRTMPLVNALHDSVEYRRAAK